MSANVTGKKQCATCNKNGGVMICGGCEQAFCGKHSTEHRHELNNQLDEIIQKHDLLQEELVQMSSEHVLFTEISTWERESIARIQANARMVREELQQGLEKSKMKIAKTCRDIAQNLRSSREADDFSEQDLRQWMDQLKQLKFELDSPSIFKLIYDQHSFISSIKLEDITSAKRENPTDEYTSMWSNALALITKERFSLVDGPVVLEESGTIARHVGSSTDYVHILGAQLYFHGRRTVRIRIQFFKPCYHTFLGCISSRITDKTIRFHSTFAAGWFGQNQVYHHSQIKDNAYNSTLFHNNDIFSIIFDCDEQRIELHHERTNTKNLLKIDMTKAPLPWQFLLVLGRPNDCVRILP